MDKRTLTRQKHHLDIKKTNSAPIPRPKRPARDLNMKKMKEDLEASGIDTCKLVGSRGKKRARSVSIIRVDKDGNVVEKDQYNDDGEILTMETRGRSRTPKRATGSSSTSDDMDIDNDVGSSKNMSRDESGVPPSKKQKKERCSVSVVRDRSMSKKTRGSRSSRYRKPSKGNKD